MLWCTGPPPLLVTNTNALDFYAPHDQALTPHDQAPNPQPHDQAPETRSLTIKPRNLQPPDQAPQIQLILLPDPLVSVKFILI